MSSISYFQTLPALIVEETVSYLLNDDDLRFNQNKTIGVSLLHSCRPWRCYFIREAFSDMQITLGSKPYVKIKYPKFYDSNFQPTFPINRLVKKISFRYENWISMDDDDNFDLFKSFCPRDIMFESAHHLDVVIHFNPSKYKLSALEKLYEILSYFWKLVPNIKSVSIESFGGTFEFKYRPICFNVSDVFCLAQGIPNVTIKRFDSAYFDYHFDMDSFTDLTSFTFECRGYTNAYHEAVCRSAASLKVLNAVYLSNEYIDDILFDEDTPIIYPNVESLCIRIEVEEDETDITSNVNHFPVLRKLCLWTTYRNYLDIFFNNHSVAYDLLEYLELCDQYGVFKYLIECYAFKTMQMKNLKAIELHLGQYYTTDDYADHSEADKLRVDFIDMAISATETFHYINIIDSIAGTCFMRLFAFPERFTFLRTLQLADIELDFLDIMSLLKAAPHLVQLGVKINHVSPLIKDVVPGDMVALIESNYINLGANILKIGVTIKENIDINMDCYIIAALAVVCPKLIYLFIRDFKIENVKTELLRISQIEAFSNYFDHLELIARKIRDFKHIKFSFP